MESARWELKNDENKVIYRFDSSVEPELLSEFLISNNNRFDFRKFRAFLREKGSEAYVTEVIPEKRPQLLP